MLLKDDHQRIIDYLRRQKATKLNIKRRQTNKSMPPKTLYDVIASECQIDIRDVDKLLIDLQQKGVVRFSRIATAEKIPLEGTLEILLVPLPKEEHELRWEKALQEFGVSIDAKPKFKKAAGSFKDFSTDDLRKLFEGLSNIAALSSRGLTKYLVSAKNLLGSSKLLDVIPKDLLDAFGIDIEAFRPSPKYIAVAGPSDPKAVVLVENPNSFEAAVLAGASEQIAWLCSYGFGLANEKSDQDGLLLESNLTTYKRHAVVLVRGGEPPRKIEELLAHPRLYFWGDLDLSGIQIFDRLKRKLQENENAYDLQLSALYQPMLEALQDGRNHPYVPLIKGNQTECELHDEMAQRVNSLCRERAVDQEIVHDGFEELGMQPLSEAMIEELFHE